MFDYILDNMLAQLPSDMNGSTKTPAASHLFEVSNTPDKLDENSAQLFHHNTAKLLFLCKTGGEARSANRGGLFNHMRQVARYGRL